MLIDAVSRRAFLAASCGAFASVWLPADPDELRASLAYAARACQAAHPPAWDFFTPAQAADVDAIAAQILPTDRKSTRLNSSHGYISYAVFCLKKKNKHTLLAAYRARGHGHGT